MMLVSHYTRQDVRQANVPIDTPNRSATVMYLDATLGEALPIPRRSWLGIIARLLAKWVRGPGALRRPRWHDSDGAHRGF
jgi:hypothetical protein